ncbi:hypothetical protein HK102_012027, partial [Quaeritorhiza haematococci]
RGHDPALAHLPEHGADQLVEPLQRVHVRRRLGVQPGLAEPGAVRRRGRRVQRRAVPLGRADLHHRAGDPGRPRELPDAEDRGQQPQVPAAGPGLREPGQHADVVGPAVRLGRRAGGRRGDHGRDARPGVPDQRRARRPGRAVRRLRDQPRADAERDGDAPPGGVRHRRVGPRGRPAGRAQDLGRVPGGGPGQRLPQQPGDGAGAHGHHRLHDGLRHHRHRARHRPGEVQAARRRRDAQDRQPDGPRRAPQARLRRAGDPRRAGLHRRQGHHRGRPGPEGRAPARLRLRLRAAAGGPEHPLPGPPPDDVGGPAVPLGGDLQDVQHAARGDRRGHPQHLPRRLEAGPEGAGDLPRRLQGEPAGVDQVRDGREGSRRGEAERRGRAGGRRRGGRTRRRPGPGRGPGGVAEA